MEIRNCGCWYASENMTTPSGKRYSCGQLFSACAEHAPVFAARRAAKLKAAEERRKLTDRLYHAARTAYEMGRGDRVAGLQPTLKWRADFYYMAGYNGAAAMETLKSAADLS